jgi:hypothetical protein
METKKRPGFDKRITPEILREMRNKFLLMSKEMSLDAMARQVAGDYPQFKQRTLEAYASTCRQVCEDVFQLMEQGKISINALLEFACGWDEATQKYVAKEYIDKGLTIGMFRELKRLKREHGTMGYAEAISRVKGEIPPEQPRKENKRSLDQLLTQLADQGNRWRASVSMALELIREEEAAMGIHEAIFQKVYVLRQLVGEQWDFVNSKVNRYINLIRKQMKAAAEGAEGKIPEARPLEEGVIDAEFKTDPGNDEAPLSGAQEK